jgi:tRNA-dihydrouridine synthase
MADVEEIYSKTNVDGVMSARGLLRNPALFAGYEYTPWECIEVSLIDRLENLLSTSTYCDSLSVTELCPHGTWVRY